jgi:hypothetical protein
VDTGGEGEGREKGKESARESAKRKCNKNIREKCYIYKINEIKLNKIIIIHIRDIV